MACLLPGSGKDTLSLECIHTAAGLLQDALRAQLGLPQPRLLDLMQVLTHIVLHITCYVRHYVKSHALHIFLHLPDQGIIAWQGLWLH